jgi:signal transduction histidine kinase
VEKLTSSNGDSPQRTGSPAHSQIGERITSEPLRSALERVAASSVDPSEGIGDAEIAEDVLALGLAVETALAGGTPELETGPGAVLRRRLLDLVRAEVIGEWLRHDPPPESREMLALLQSFERVREALDPEADHQFASQLMGPEGLEHLMEIAHDLRSPLTSILFLAETLRRGQSGPINDVQHRQLGIVYSAALGLTSVVSDVIELARGGNRLMEKEPSPFSVMETLESVRDIVRPISEEKGLTMRLLPPAGDRRLGYPVALSRVLLNLTSNALKFTDEGSVEILARAKGTTRVEFSVRDTGNGIKPDVLATLYRPFRRTRTRNRYAFSGSGLGLAICRKLVEAMGSELQLESNPDWGTRFFFELDLPPLTL